jgi:hypothetical protein
MGQDEVDSLERFSTVVDGDVDVDGRVGDRIGLESRAVVKRVRRRRRGSPARLLLAADCCSLLPAGCSLLVSRCSTLYARRSLYGGSKESNVVGDCGMIEMSSK